VKRMAFLALASVPFLIFAVTVKHDDAEAFAKAKGRVLSATDAVFTADWNMKAVTAKLMNKGSVTRAQVHRAFLNLRRAETRYRIVSRDVLETATLDLHSGEAIWGTWSE
jgi:hypothetical protein